MNYKQSIVIIVDYLFHSSIS